jgi:hypothetical protein
MSTEADDAAHAQARQLEADNPLWLVIFGVYSKEFVCFPRFGVTSGPIAAKEPATLPPRMRQIESSTLRTPITPRAG